MQNLPKRKNSYLSVLETSDSLREAAISLPWSLCIDGGSKITYLVVFYILIVQDLPCLKD